MLVLLGNVGGYSTPNGILPMKYLQKLKDRNKIYLNTRRMIKIGDRVEKVSGYKYPGIIVAKFNKIDSGEERFVVECTASVVSGMLHIFREGQLKKVKEKKSVKKWWPWGKESFYDT